MQEEIELEPLNINNHKLVESRIGVNPIAPFSFTFENSNTHIEVQKVMLVTSMAYMTSAYDNKSSPLTEIADKHNKNNLNIRPHLYSLWIDSLIASAKLIDPLFDINTEKMWREVLQSGIDYMISRYSLD